MFKKIWVRTKLLSIFGQCLGQDNPYKLSPVPNYIYYDGLNNHLPEAKRLGLDSFSSAMYIIQESLYDIPASLCTGEERTLGALGMLVHQARRSL